MAYMVATQGNRRMHFKPGDQMLAASGAGVIDATWEKRRKDGFVLLSSYIVHVINEIKLVTIGVYYNGRPRLDNN